MIAFRMPSLGADMEAGTLVRWLKQPGDPVARGDIIALVDTDKGAIEIEVFDDGVLDRAVVEPGQKVPVGTVLAYIRGAGEPAGAPGSEAPPAARKISPAARKAAAELHVDLSAVDPTGPGGSVTRADVERAASRGRDAAARPAAPAEGASGAPEAPGRGASDRAAAMRAAIAAAMARSKREIPHLYLATAIDVERLQAWLAAENERRGVTARLLLIAPLLKAVARAAAEVTGLNGFWIDGAFRPGAGIHLGCAVALRGGGLVAPALHDVDRTDLDTLMGALRDLVTRARAGSLRSSELADATLTVTNLGDLGVDAAFGIIYPPQVALVAFGRVAERPGVREGRVEPRPIMQASISADHRAVDGRQAGLFLGAIERWIQKPEEL